MRHLQRGRVVLVGCIARLWSECPNFELEGHTCVYVYIDVPGDARPAFPDKTAVREVQHAMGAVTRSWRHPWGRLWWMQAKCWVYFGCRIADAAFRRSWPTRVDELKQRLLVFDCLQRGKRCDNVFCRSPEQQKNAFMLSTTSGAREET